MTVIAGIIDKNRGVIASDTFGTGWINTDPYGSKVIRVFDGVAIGYCGTYVLDRWARRSFGPVMGKKARLWRDDLEAFQEVLEDAWDEWQVFNANRGDWKATTGGNCLVVVPGAIFELQSDGSVLPCERRYAAIGSGGYHAMGALAAMPNNMTLVNRAKKAVEIAIEHSPGCGGDAVAIELER